MSFKLLTVLALLFFVGLVGGAVASRLVRSDRVIPVRALAGDTAVFLDKTLYSHSAFLHRCINGYWRI